MKVKANSRKSVRWSTVPVPLCEYVLMCDGERGSGPKEADDLCLVIFDDLGLKVSINNGTLASRLGFGI